VRAATVVARLRFTIRAYLREGRPPDRVLEMCTGEIDVLTDNHFSTVLVGIGNLETREITLANAGHLNPLLLSHSHPEFVLTAVGLPSGVRRSTYRPTSFAMPPGRPWWRSLTDWSSGAPKDSTSASNDWPTRHRHLPPAWRIC
jgi:serine phosphatase RsbU (regulator of sigma subunit)